MQIFIKSVKFFQPVNLAIRLIYYRPFWKSNTLDQISVDRTVSEIETSGKLINVQLEPIYIYYQVY